MRWSPLTSDQVKHLYRTEPLAEWAEDSQVTEIKADTPSFRMGMMTGKFHLKFFSLIHEIFK